ncbi:MAG: hypothetical protein ABSB49_09800 [Polyangia bacterium]|jgi:hypothetical protein
MSYLDSSEIKTLKGALQRFVKPDALDRVARQLEGRFGPGPEEIRAGAIAWITSADGVRYRRPAAAVAFLDALRGQGY